MALPRTPRTAWIEEGLRVLAHGGPDAVRVEALAKGLGVTKGGFYGYFSDRAALLGEMLDTWEREVTSDLIGRVEAEGGDGRARLTLLFAIVDRRDGQVGEVTTDIMTDLSIRDWARRDPLVARRLRRVDGLRMDYLRALFREFCPDDDEVEVRATMAFALWIAQQLVAFDHGNRTDAEMDDLIRSRLLR